MRQLHRISSFVGLTSCLFALCLAADCAAQAPTPPAVPAAQPAPAAPLPPIDWANDKYDEIRDYEETPRVEMQRIVTVLRKATENGKFETPKDEDDARKYFRARAAAFTWPEAIKELPKRRKDIGLACKTCFGINAVDRTLHTWLNTELLNNFKAIATNAGGRKYNPVGRYNAMLVIAALNQVEPDISGRGAEPWSKAWETLTTAVALTTPPANDDAQLDAVRIAAMDGVVRHAELAKAPETRRQAATFCTTVAATKKPAAGDKLQPASLGWMRKRAVEALMAMAVRGAPEANRPECVNAVRSVLEDLNITLLGRADAALALGAFEKAAIGPARVADDIEGIGWFVVDCKPTPAQLAAGQVTPDAWGHFFASAAWGLRGFTPNEQNRPQADPASVRGVMNSTNDKAVKDLGNKVLARVDDLVKVCTARNFDANAIGPKIDDLKALLKPRSAAKPAGEPVAEAPAGGAGGNGR